MALLRHDNDTSEDLLGEYIDFQKKHAFWKFVFNYGPVSIPIPELREKIEFKIIQEFFIRSYSLPEEFKFANYTCLVLKEYIIGLVEVRPISWLFLSTCVALNYGKIAIIDPKYQYALCRSYLERQEKTYESQACPEYLLRYVLLCSALMALYFFFVFIASEIYIRRLIDKILDVEEVLQLIEAEENIEETNLVHQNKDGTASTVPGDTDLENSHTVDVADQLQNNKVVHHRRHLYFKCLERIMEIELEFHQNSARRESSHPVDVNHPESANASKPNSSRFFFAKALLSQLSLSAPHPPSSSPSLNDSARLGNLPDTASIDDEEKSRNSARRNSINRSRLANSQVYRDSLIRMQTRGINFEDSVEDKQDSISVSESESPQDGTAQNFPRSRNNSYVSTETAHHDTIAALLGQNNSMQSVEEIKMVLQKQVQERQKHLSIRPTGREADAVSGSDANLNGKEETSINPSAASYQRCGGDDNDPDSYLKEASSSNTNQPPDRHHVSFDVKAERTDIKHNFRHSLKWKKHLFSSSPTSSKGAVKDRNHVSAANDPSADQEPDTDSIDRKSRKSHRIKRAYSLEYFDMHQSLEQYQEQSRKKKESENSCSAACFQRMTMKRGEDFMSFSQSLWFAGRWLLLRVLEILLSSKEESEELAGDIRSTEDAYNKIFLFHSPTLYYLIVELALLLQCVYIALWATNFVVIVTISDHPILWQFLLLLPLPLNFFVLKQIIFTSSMLKAVVRLDKGIANKICEEAVDVRNVTQRLRKAVRRNLISQHPNAHERSIFVKKKFEYFCGRNDARKRVDTKRFLEFLHSLKLFLTDESVSKIFSIIDFDNDGWISWNDLHPILFPELQKRKLTILSRKSVTASGRLSFEYSREGESGDNEGEHVDDGGVQMSTFTNPAAMEPKFYLNKIFRRSMAPQMGTTIADDNEEFDSEKGLYLDEDEDESERVPAAEQLYLSSDDDSDADNDDDNDQSKTSEPSRTGTDSFRLQLPAHPSLPRDTATANNLEPSSHRRVSFSSDTHFDPVDAATASQLESKEQYDRDDHPAGASLVLVERKSSVMQDQLFYDV